MDRDDHKIIVDLTVKAELACRTYLPANYSDEGDRKPLLLFLHGGGERGSDLDLLTATALPKHIEEGLQLPFVTVCPQCPEGEWWDPQLLAVLLVTTGCCRIEERDLEYPAMPRAAPALLPDNLETRPMHNRSVETGFRQPQVRRTH